MKKYSSIILICIINCILIKSIYDCWRMIPNMPSDSKATLMTWCTFGLWILELVVFVYSQKFFRKYSRLNKK